MQLRANRSTRSPAYLLAKLSPLDVANATQAYVDSQSPDRIAALVQHAVVRMEPAERRQLGTIFGVQAPEHDSFFDEAAPPIAALASAVDASSDRVSDLFLRFLRQNPRALTTLDRGALEAIINHAVALGTTDVEDAVPSEEIDPAEESAHRFESIAMTAIDAFGAIGRPFVAAGNAVVRTIAAIPRLLLAGLLWLAQPFVWAYRVIIAIPRALLAALLWLAQPFVWTYRGIVALPGLIARVVMAGLRFAALPFVAIGRAFANGMRAVRAIRPPKIRLPNIRPPKIQLPAIRFPKVRLPWVTAAIFAAAIAYGAISGVAILAFRHASGHAPAATVAAARPPVPPARARHSAKHVQPPRRHPARVAIVSAPKTPARPHAATKRNQPPPAAVKRSPKRVASAPRRVGRREHRRKVDVADLPIVVHARPGRSQLVERARLEVASYLASLKRGDQRGALTRLGLAPDAPASNLTEARAISSGRFRIVDAAPAENGAAKVDVEIRSQAQHFFGVYTVSAIGPAVQITSHTLIPVGGPGAIAGP